MHQINLPDGAALNPSAPYNRDDVAYRYEVKRDTTWKGDFKSEQDAVAFVTGLTGDDGEMIIWELADDVWDTPVCVGHYVWDAETGKYVKA